MIGPLVLPDSPSELAVIVGPAADIDDEEVILMILVEITGDVIDGIAVCLFEEVRSRIRHRYDSIGYVGEIQLLTIEGSFLLGTGDKLADDGFHL